MAQKISSRHNSDMTSASHIALLVHVGDALLLERAAPDALLDAGQWRLPQTTQRHAVIAPHAAMCGIELSAAAGVMGWLAEHELDAKAVLACEHVGSHDSPPWHPARQRVEVVKLTLNVQPQARAEETWRWADTQTWLNAWRNEALLLNPFTQAILQSHATTRPFVWHQITQEQPIAGLHIVPVRSHTLPPATHTNAFVLGLGQAHSPRVLVDPSPADDVALTALLQHLQDQPIDAIFLTHHHPDHHQNATRLARHWSCPVWCSRDTQARIPARFGADYWDQIELRIIDDGQTLTTWQGHKVLAHAVPGHDAGQMALMPEGRQWMIVGDLIQGVGTVVIAQPEGNMADYFRTLQWVLDQDPAVIVPSHGQAMGTTFRIAETLRHRQLREQQVLDLHRQGHTAQAMVEQIYANVDKRLWRLARMNIDCHLEKLEQEGRL